MSDLRTQLRLYLDATAPPVDLEEIRTDQVWVPPRQQPAWRRHIPGWAYGVIAALVVVALTLGLELLLPAEGDGELVDEPPPSTIPPEPPPELHGETGTMDTIIGPLTWIHASSSENLLPDYESVVQTPTGFAGVRHTWTSPAEETSQWTTSADGGTWTVEPFPVQVRDQGAVNVGELDGRYWITDGVGLWLSEDFESWVTVDLSSLQPPSSTGLVWESSDHHLAASGSLLVFSRQLWPRLPLRDVFDPASEFTGGVYQVGCGWAWELEICEDADDEIQVVFGVSAATGEETLLGQVRVDSEGGDAAFVVDIDTGARIHEFTVAGLTGSQLAAGITTSNLHFNTIGVVQPDLSVRRVETPWPAFGNTSITMFGVADRLLAFVDTGTSATLGAIEVWESKDGTTWISRGTPELGIELSGEIHVAQVFERRGLLIADIQHELEQSIPSDIRLFSADGLSWEPAPTSAPAFAVQPVPNGFIAVGDRLWVSADGFTWQQLNILDRQAYSVLLVGDTLIATYERDGAFDTWAFDLDP